mmetsp:Transcript_24181/g.45649  ORF Transcript_24181/g.45649 Transcript_24181/m.45649 type:complete len:313 (-) Transcript_24181:212-1150(-)
MEKPGPGSPTHQGIQDFHASEDCQPKAPPNEQSAEPLSPPESPTARAQTAPTPGRVKGGPVGQSVMHLSTLRRAPKYSFRGARDRFKTRGLRAAAQVPGPGEYGKALVAQEAYSSRHRRSPGYGFGTGAREANTRPLVPGPGAYPRASTGFIGSGRAFSLTPRRWTGGELETDPALPGPGAHIQDIQPDGPKYSILPRRPPVQADTVFVPGPAQYGMMEGALGRTKPRLPSWGFGTSQRQGSVQIEDRPVAGIKGKSTAAAWMSKLPGPGSYNAPSSVGEGPKFSVGARRAAARRATTPGPGDTGGPYTTFA